MIDLSNGVRPVFRFLRANPTWYESVEKVSISYGERSTSCMQMMMDEDDLFNLFAVVGSFPMLQTLTIHFEDQLLPVSALTVLLQQAQGLSELGLFHLRLMGSVEDFDALEETVQQHQVLEAVRLVHCRRHDYDHHYFSDNFSSDNSHCSPNSSIAFDDKENSACHPNTTPATASITPRSGSKIKRIPHIFCQSPCLRRLWLQDCPDYQIESVAQAIQADDSPSRLKELSIVSSTVGDRGIESLSKMLKSETGSLEALSITVFRRQAIRVAEAADCNSTLKKLTCDILNPMNKPTLLAHGPMRI